MRFYIKPLIISSFLFCTFIFPTGFKWNSGHQIKEGLIPMRIDTHIHLYDTRREGSSTFLDPVRHKKIYNPHLPEDFLRVSSPCKVNYGIAVEASHRPEDNYWLIDIVNGSESMLACIGNLDPRDPGYLDDLNNLESTLKCP